MNRIIILFIVLFCLAELSAQNANVSYEVRISNANGVRSTEGSWSSSASCQETGNEEYTALLRVNNPTTGTWVCRTCDTNGDCNYGHGTVLRTTTNVSTINYVVQYDMFEDDGGGRCTYDSGDDCRAVGSLTFNFVNNWFPSSANAYNHYTDNQVYNAGGSEHRVRLDHSWRYAGTANSITPACNNQTVAYSAGAIRSFSSNLSTANTYRFSTCGSSGDTWIRIYASDGFTIVASNDDNGPACGGAQASVDFNPASAGVYYIEISNFTRAALSNAGTLNYQIIGPYGGTATLGTLSTTGPVNFCNSGGNYGTALSLGGYTNGLPQWEWGSNNGVWNTWVTGPTAGNCCFPKKTSNSNGSADRIRVRVIGCTTTGYSSTVLIRNEWNEAPNSLGKSLDNVCPGTTVTLSATFPTATNMNGNVQFYSGSCGGTLVATVAGNGTTTVSTNITAPATTTNYFARYTGAFSGCGTTVCATTTLTINFGAPTATAASAGTCTQWRANWNAQNGATSYRLDVATDNGFANMVINNLNVGNVTSYDLDLPLGTYYYRVRSVNACFTSLSSNTISRVISNPANNNDFRNAIDVTAWVANLNVYSSSFNNTGYNTQSGEPTPHGMYSTAWYKFTTPASGLTRVTAWIQQSTGADNPTVAIYRRNANTCPFGNLTELTSDWWCDATSGSVSTTCLAPNTTYYVQYGTNDCWWDGGSNGAFNVTITPSTTPQGPDNLCSAGDLGTISAGYYSGDVFLNNSCNTLQSGEPRPSDEYNTAWYKFRTPATGLVSVNVQIDEAGEGSDNSTVALYQLSGSCGFGNLTKRADNWWCASSGGSISYDCLPGNTDFYIQTGTTNCTFDGGDPGRYRLRVSASSYTAAPSTICTAIQVGSSTIGVNQSATTSTYTNNCSTPNWFYFTTPATVPAQYYFKFNNIGDFGTWGGLEGQVYKLTSGTLCSSPAYNLVGEWDPDACGVVEESGGFCLDPNSTYLIRVKDETDGLCGGRGRYQVSVRGNDHVKAPATICAAVRVGTSTIGVNQAATTGTYTNVCNAINWFWFNTPASVPAQYYFKFNNIGDFGIWGGLEGQVYKLTSGTLCSSPVYSLVGEWDPDACGVEEESGGLCLDPNSTYLIRVKDETDGLCGGRGRYQLRVRGSNTSAGPDNICSAQSMGTFASYSSGTISLTSLNNQSNECATTQTNEPSGGQKTTWYTFTTGSTVGRDLNITVDATAGGMDAEVSVYRACGTVCTSSNLNAGILQEIANFWDVLLIPALGIGEWDASGTITGQIRPSTTYYVRVDGIDLYPNGLSGTYNLSVSMSGGTYNGNDNFCNAWTVGASNSPGGSGAAHTESVNNNDILDLGETITIPTFNNKSASSEEDCGLDEPNNDEDDETVWFKVTTGSNPGTMITIDANAINDGVGGLDCIGGLSFAWVKAYKATSAITCPFNYSSSTNAFSPLTEAGRDDLVDASKYYIDCPEPNTTYYIQVENTGIGCDRSSFTMTVKDNGIPRAPNDRICNATVLSTPSLASPQSLVGTYTPHTLVNQNNFCATKTGEPTPSCFGSLNQPVWYKLPAAAAPGASDISNPGRKVAIVHARSNHAAGDEDEINLQLALYTNTNMGSCPTNPTTGFTQRACAYEGPLSLDPDQLFNLSEYLDASCLVPATDYYLMVDGHSPWYDLLGNWKEGWFEFDVYYPREIGDLPCSAVPFRLFGDPAINKAGLSDALLNNSNLCTTYTPGTGANQEPAVTFTTGDGNDNPGWVYFYAPPSGSVKITAVSDPQDLIKAGIIFDNLDLQLAIFQEATQGNCAVVQMPQSPVGSSISYNILDGFDEEMYVNCLTPGRKYYIMIDAAPWGPFNSTKGIFDLYIEDWPDYAAATNDELCDAIPMDTSWFGSTYHWSQLNNKLTARVQNTNNWCADNLNEPGRPVLGGYNETGVWYSFVAPPSGKVYILAENTTYGSITKPSGDPEHIDLSLAVYKLNSGFACTQYANPAAMTLIAQDYQNPLADLGVSVLGTALSDEEMEVECLVPGETYYLLVSGKKSAGLGSDWDYGKFNLYVTSDPRNPAAWNGNFVTVGGKQYLPKPAQATNDLVCNAADLGTINTNANWYQPFSSRKVPFNCSANTVQSPPFNNFCATSTGDPQPGYQQDLINTFGGNHKPVWFKFTTPATGAFDPAKISVEVEAISDGCNTAIFGNWYSDGCSANSEHYEDCIALGVSVWLPSDGSCTGDLYEMDSDYDPIPYDESAIVHCLLPGTTYYIMVDGGALNREGNFNLRIRQVQPDVVAPNNFICDAKKLTSGAGTSPASFWGAGAAYKYEDEFNICADTRNNSSSGAGTEPIPSGWDVLNPPSDAADMTHTVWYYFKTPTTGGPYAVQIDVDSDLPWPFGDLVNPKIAVWESQDGTCNYSHPNGANMVEIASEYDPLAFWGETMRAYCLEANKTYYVQVGGTPFIPGHDQGFFDITINDITPIDIPANDDVCSAFNVGTSSSSGSVTISSTQGGKIGNAASGANNYHNYCTDLEPGEPQPDAFTADNTVWFKFQTPATAGKRYDITINANSDPSPSKNDNINLQLALYEATNGCNFNGFTEIASDFDPILWGETLTATCLKPATTYYIQVDGSKGFLELFRALGFGYFGLEVVTDRVYDAPVNDNACNATALGTVPVGGSINNGIWYYNNCATIELNEPDPVGNIIDYDIDKTVWFTFIPGRDADFRVSAISAGLFDDPIDLQVAVFRSTATNAGCPDLSVMVQEGADYTPPFFDEDLDLSCLKQGETYYIQIDGSSLNMEGNFRLVITDRGASTSAPANDNFCIATLMTFSGSSVELTDQNNRCATVQVGEPNAPADVQKSVWYRFQAPASGRVRITLHDADNGFSGIDPEMYVYEMGANWDCSSFSSITQIASSYNPIQFPFINSTLGDEVVEYECFQPDWWYLVQVDGTTVLGPQGTFDIKLEDLLYPYTVVSGNKPANDDIASAITVPVRSEQCVVNSGDDRIQGSGSWTTYNYAKPTRDLVNGLGGNGCSVADLCGDTWYKFTVPTITCTPGYTPIQVQGKSLTGSNRSQLSVIAYKGSPGALTAIGCGVAENAGLLGINSQYFNFEINEPAGTVIYLQVFGEDALDWDKDFELCVSERKGFDYCAHAAESSPLQYGVEYCYNIKGATGEPINEGYPESCPLTGIPGIPSPDGDAPTENSVYFKFVTDNTCADYKMTFKYYFDSYSSLNNKGISYSIYKDDTPCDGVPVAAGVLDCQAFYNSSISLNTYEIIFKNNLYLTVQTGIDTSSVYYIQIDGPGQTYGNLDGTIKIEQIPACFDFEAVTLTTTSAGWITCGDGWQHYHDGGNPKKYIFSLFTNGNQNLDGTAKIFYDHPANLWDASRQHYAAAQYVPGGEASWVMRRYWDFETTAGTVDPAKPVTVRFYYVDQEKQAIINSMVNFEAQYSSPQEGFEWFKQQEGWLFKPDEHINPSWVTAKYGSGSTVSGITGAPYTFTALDNQISCNGVRYVELSGIVGFSGGSGATGNGPVLSPLPIELISFTGYHDAERYENILLWSTASERNNDKFIVEKSADGVNFFPIGEVRGHGTTSVTHNYIFADKNPLNGYNYYRLRQVDFDGTFELTNIILIDVYAASVITETKIENLYPNPTDGDLNVVMSVAKPSKMKMKVYNVIGELLFTTDLNFDKGRYTYVLKSNRYAEGTYIIHVEDATSGRIYTAKFVKQ